MKTKKKSGDPFEKNDQVWVDTLDGKLRAGFYCRKSKLWTGKDGKLIVFVSTTKNGGAGWWSDEQHLRHRFLGDGVEGEQASVQATHGTAQGSEEDVDPLLKR